MAENIVVERCVAAAKHALNSQDDDNCIRDDGNITKLWGDFDIHAVVRAVLVAASEPTDAMLNYLDFSISLIKEGSHPEVRRHMLSQAWRLTMGAAISGVKCLLD